ncbi:MAG: ABC transporter substrate-binding protein [Aggregatilineaceae bacterium]
MLHRLWSLVVVFVVFFASGLAGFEDSLTRAQEPGLVDVRLPERRTVRFQLDWTPNTNHIGIYVAQALGFYDDVNLDVQIVRPSDTDQKVIEAIEDGAVEFGINYQEYTTFALAEGAELVAVAAIIQHNTTGFASYADRNPVTRPADLANLTYYGSGKVAEAIISRLVACDGAQWQPRYAQLGVVDLVEVLKAGDADFGWIYYGWEGIEAELRGIDLDVIMLRDYSECIPDYYTPLIVTSRRLVETEPDLIRAFIYATARGFQIAIDYPLAAAQLLLAAEPQLNPELVRASALWLAPRYQEDAPRWGEQQLEVWQRFTDFLVQEGLLDTPIDVSRAFTNDFLPG